MSSSSQDFEFLDLTGVSEDDRQSLLALFAEQNPAVVVPAPDVPPSKPEGPGHSLPTPPSPPPPATPPKEEQEVEVEVEVEVELAEEVLPPTPADKEVETATCIADGDFAEKVSVVAGSASPPPPAPAPSVTSSTIAASTTTTTSVALASSCAESEGVTMRGFSAPPPNIGGPGHGGMQQGGQQQAAAGAQPQQVYQQYSTTPTNPPVYNPHMPPPTHHPPPGGLYTHPPPPILSQGPTVYVANCHVNLSPYGGTQAQVPVLSSTPGPSQSPPAAPALVPILPEPAMHLSQAKSIHDGKPDFDSRRYNEPYRPAHRGRGRGRGRGKRNHSERSSSVGSEHSGYGGDKHYPDGLQQPYGNVSSPYPSIYHSMPYPVRGGAYHSYSNVPAAQTVQGLPLIYSQQPQHYPQYMQYSHHGSGHLVPYQQHPGPPGNQHPNVQHLPHQHHQLTTAHQHPPSHQQQQQQPPQYHHHSEHHHIQQHPTQQDPTQQHPTQQDPHYHIQQQQQAQPPQQTNFTEPLEINSCADSHSSETFVSTSQPSTSQFENGSSVGVETPAVNMSPSVAAPDKGRVSPLTTQTAALALEESVEPASSPSSTPASSQEVHMTEGQLLPTPAPTIVKDTPTAVDSMQGTTSQPIKVPQVQVQQHIPSTVQSQAPATAQPQVSSAPAQIESAPVQPAALDQTPTAPEAPLLTPHSVHSQSPTQPQETKSPPQTTPQPQIPAQSAAPILVSAPSTTPVGNQPTVDQPVSMPGSSVYPALSKGKDLQSVVSIAIDHTSLSDFTFMSDEIQPNVDPQEPLGFVSSTASTIITPQAAPASDAPPNDPVSAGPTASLSPTHASDKASPQLVADSGASNVSRDTSVVSAVSPPPPPTAAPSVAQVMKPEMTLPPVAASMPGGAWAQKKRWSQLFKPCDDAGAKQVAYVAPFNQESEKISEEIPPADTATNRLPDPAWSETDLDKAKIGAMLREYVQDHHHAALQPRGLINKGYWCYVNAPLQALLACPPFYNLMKNIPNIAGLKKGKSSTPVIDSIVEYIHEFTDMAPMLKPCKKDKNNSAARKEPDIVTGTPFELTYIYKMLTTMNGDMFTDGRQQDAEEMLSFVLNGLHEEMVEALKLANEVNPPASSSNGSINGTLNGEYTTSDHEELSDDSEEWQVMGPRKRSCVTRTAAFTPSPISAIFWGQLRSVLHQAAGHTTANLQPFTTLPLDIQAAKVESVRDALEHLVSREEIGDYTSKTNQDVTVYKQVLLEHLPNILILQLKRFIYDKDGGLQKVMKKISFPVDLEITKELMSAQSRGKFSVLQRKYKLLAVVYHDGKEATKGHYVADIYHSGYNCWLRYDDSCVKVVSEASVVRHVPPRVPYLLFYRRGDTMVGPSVKNKS